MMGFCKGKGGVLPVGLPRLTFIIDLAFYTALTLRVRFPEKCCLN